MQTRRNKKETRPKRSRVWLAMDDESFAALVQKSQSIGQVLEAFEYRRVER